MFLAPKNFISQLQRFDCTILAITFTFFYLKEPFLILQEKALLKKKEIIYSSPLKETTHKNITLPHQ